MMKILILANHRLNRSPGQRFRIEQYIDYLKENGFEVDFSYFISEKDDKIYYAKGKYLKKLFIVVKSICKRMRDIRNITDYSLVYVYREAIMLGTVYFEKRIAKKTKLIYDFDDSIWLNDVSLGNRDLKWLKNPKKTAKIVKLAHLVIVGNAYLEKYARQFNDNVCIIPTTINTDYHKKNLIRTNGKKICIGWTGTSTTLKHFQTALPFLHKLMKKFKDKISFKLIVDIDFSNEELGIHAKQWNLVTEIEDLLEIDIGIMPLPNDEWSKGKCGFKGLQYMALEIPTIMSPVGVNTEIIRDGENGFLAEAEEEWIDKLSRLIESKELREKLGKAGRKTVVEQYSFDAWKEKYLEYFRALAE